MAECKFDMHFTLVLLGWEGSAHDTRIFYSAIRDPSKKNSTPPSGKFYLVDAGYPNVSGFLSPYKGQKYHIPKFQHDFFLHIKDKNITSLNFNMMHTITKYSIMFTHHCVQKKKFEIMNNMPVNMKWPYQLALVATTMGIHDFIRKSGHGDVDFMEAERIVKTTQLMKKTLTMRVMHTTLMMQWIS